MYSLSAVLPIFKGSGIFPASFFYHKGKGSFMMKIGICGHKCYACCQASWHIVYTKAMLAAVNGNIK